LWLNYIKPIEGFSYKLTSVTRQPYISSTSTSAVWCSLAVSMLKPIAQNVVCKLLLPFICLYCSLKPYSEIFQTSACFLIWEKWRVIIGKTHPTYRSSVFSLTVTNHIFWYGWDLGIVFLMDGCWQIIHFLKPEQHLQQIPQVISNMLEVLLYC